MVFRKQQHSQDVEGKAYLECETLPPLKLVYYHGDKYVFAVQLSGLAKEAHFNIKVL